MSVTSIIAIMAHDRQRQVSTLFSRLLRFSPIIGIFGHRQVGKTTFASALGGKYLTLDGRETRNEISSDPKKFIVGQHRLPTVIDECQLEPSLFPALKERIRTDKRPGQFVLTGSVRFTSRKTIRESLAGRMSTVEFYPLVLSELMRSPLPDVLPQFLEAPVFNEASLTLLKSAAECKTTQKNFEKYLLAGGLPGLCFIRDERLRREGLSALHHLILDRDLRLVVETKLSLETLGRYLRLIAKNGWNAYNASAIRREIGLAPQTQKNILFGLESIFFIRRIPLKGRAGEIILMEDQYEERFLSDGSHSRSDQVLSAFFRNARAQFQYRLGADVRFESYWTRSGARVPLVIRTDKAALGFIAISGGKATLSQQRSADSFLRHESRGKVIFLAEQPQSPLLVDPRVLTCPAASLL